MPKVPIRVIVSKVKETNDGTIETSTDRVNTPGMGNYNCNNNYNRNNNGNRMTELNVIYSSK